MKYDWWIFQILLILVSLFFFLFGINLLIAAYDLADPFTFIMTFFAASFILLISATLMITFTIKMFRVFKRVRSDLPNSHG